MKEVCISQDTAMTFLTCSGQVHKHVSISSDSVY